MYEVTIVYSILFFIATIIMLKHNNIGIAAIYFIGLISILSLALYHHIGDKIKV